MSTAQEARSAVEQAVRGDDLELLIRGDYPYSIPEEYMAPSTVPTNWSSMIYNGLDAAVQADPSLAKKLDDALVALGGDPEGVYCSLEFLYTYLNIQSRQKIFGLDVNRISDAIRNGIALLGPQIRTLRPSWIEPSENLWDRVVRISDLMKADHGISVI